MKRLPRTIEELNEYNRSNDMYISCLMIVIFIGFSLIFN